MRHYNVKEDTEALKNFVVVLEAAPELPFAKESLIISSLFNAGCCEYRLKKYDAAIEHFDRLTEDFPSAAKCQDALFYLGDLYLRTERYDDAIKSYQAFIEANPESVDAIIDAKLQISLSYSKKKEPEGALKVLDSLGKDYPGQLLLKQKCDHLHFLVYTDSEQIEKAAVLGREIAKQGNNPWANEVCFRAGNLFFEKEKYSEAIDFYHQVKPKAAEIKELKISLEETKARKVYESDRSAVGYKRWEESTLEYLIKGVEANPDLLPHALYQIGKCHFSLKDYKTAEQTYSKILEQYGEQEELSELIERTRVEAGLCYLKEGDEKAFEQIISEVKSEEARYILLQGLHKEKEYKALIKEYKKGVFSFEKEEDKSAGLYLIADAYYGIEDFQTALELFGEVVEKYPESEQLKPAQFRVGQCYLKLKQHRQAIPIWKELLETYPDRKPDVIYMLAYTYLYLKEYSKSLDYTGRFLEEYPEHKLVPENLLCKGSALMGQKKYAEAIVNFQKLIEKYPADELVRVAYANIGRIYYYQEKFAKMVKIFLMLEEKYPQDKEIQAEARYWLGLNDERNHRFDIAIDKYLEIIGSYPESEWVKQAQLRIGSCYAQQKQYRKATEAYLVAVDKWREDKDYLLRVLGELNMMFWKTQEYTKAIKLYKRLIQEYNDEPVTVDYLSFGLAGVYYYAGDDRKSATIYERLLAVLPEEFFSSQDRYMISEVFFKTGNYRGVVDNYLTLLSQRPVPPKAFVEEAVKGIARCYLKLKDASVAKELRRLTKDYPYTVKLPEVSLAFAEINRLEQKYNAAIPLYKEAALKLSDDELTTQALFGLGECYRHLGNYKEAALCYKRMELLYGYYTEWADKAKVGFEECNKHLEAEKAVTSVAE